MTGSCQVDQSGMRRTVHAAIEKTLGGPESDVRERQERLGVTLGGPCAHMKRLDFARKVTWIFNKAGT